MVGTLARIRPSAVMRSPSRGTLRSVRTNTRLPETSRSSIVRMVLSFRGVVPYPRQQGGAPAPGPGVGGAAPAQARAGSSGQRFEPTSLAASTRRLEKPHSLSYQPTILTVLPKAMVRLESKVHEGAVPTMSEDTIGSSV